MTRHLSASLLFSMVTIYNSELSNELVKGAKIQTSRDSIPNRLADSVVPTMEVNPEMLRKNNIATGNTSTTATGTYTLYTTPTDRDFYLTSYALSVIKDVVCDTATGASITMTAIGREGETLQLASMPTITLTAQSYHHSNTLMNPILLKRGSTILLSGAFAAGVCVRVGRLTGYIVNNSLA